MVDLADPDIKTAFDINKDAKFGGMALAHINPALKMARHTHIPCTSLIRVGLTGEIREMNVAVGVVGDTIKLAEFTRLALRVAVATTPNPVAVAADAIWAAEIASDWAEHHVPQSQKDNVGNEAGFLDAAANGINTTRKGVEFAINTARAEHADYKNTMAIHYANFTHLDPRAYAPNTGNAPSSLEEARQAKLANTPTVSTPSVGGTPNSTLFTPASLQRLKSISSAGGSTPQQSTWVPSNTPISATMPEPQPPF